MINGLKIAAFVPAKGMSERVKNKNLSILGGEYLFKRKLKQLLKSKYIDEVFLDTESEFIIDAAKDLDIQILKRDKNLASNATDGHELFKNESAHTDADIVIQALSTAPFVSEDTYDRAIESLVKSGRQSLVAVFSDRQYTWDDGSPRYGWAQIPNSNDLPQTTIEAMSLYIVRRNQPDEVLQRRFTNDVVLFELSRKESLDIDTNEDLELCKAIANADQSKIHLEIRTLPIWTTVSNTIDVMTELGIAGFLGHEIKPLKNQTAFAGPAKTLSIRPVKAGDQDDWKNVYQALDSYDFLMQGDVIVVNNPIANRAYFGDLNASLAYRRGCNGVIVNGFTRDSSDLIQNFLPVFAKGCSPQDVKFHGALDTMGMPVNINGVTVKNGDIIFADSDGACCIPAEKFPLVISCLKDLVTTETSIKIGALNGVSGPQLIQRNGLF